MNQTARPYLYCFEEVEVEAGEEAEGEEAHHQEVGNQDIIPQQEIQLVSFGKSTYLEVWKSTLINRPGVAGAVL